MSALTEVFVNNGAMFALFTQLSDLFTLIHEVVGPPRTYFLFVLDACQDFRPFLREL